MTDPTQPVLRFAPSPNGRLHLGHALSALITFETARRLGGRFLLRIEDIDVGRTREEFVTGIFEDLDWLGLTWEEPVLRQSMRFDAYRTAAGTLAARGLVYPCAATRSAAQMALGDGGERDPDGALRYRPICPGGRYRRPAPPCASSGEPVALRLDMTTAQLAAVAISRSETITYADWDLDERLETRIARPEIWGDAVVVRKDVPTSYHLAVVVDDAFQGVTHVTRGQDLERATDLHRLLQVLLGLPAPIYHHHRLVSTDDGRKLSKSAGDTSLQHLRAEGVTPGEIRRLVGL